MTRGLLAGFKSFELLIMYLTGTFYVASRKQTGVQEGLRGSRVGLCVYAWDRCVGCVRQLF